MADVQVENGYTRIANELMEAKAIAGAPGVEMTELFEISEG